MDTLEGTILHSLDVITAKSPPAFNCSRDALTVYILWI